MKLIIAVVRDELASGLTEKLTHKGFGATKLASTGGFLKAGNTTFLIGVSSPQLSEVIEIIKQACPGQKSIAGDLTFAEGTLKSAAVGQGKPTKLEVAGATVFVVDVEKMVKV